MDGGGGGGSGGEGGGAGSAVADTPQYAPLSTLCGSLYTCVLTPLYMHVHTDTVKYLPLSHAEVAASLSRKKHTTLSVVAGLPTGGCSVLRKPRLYPPHPATSSHVTAIRVPAGPTNRYQLAVLRSVPNMGDAAQLSWLYRYGGV